MMMMMMIMIMMMMIIIIIIALCTCMYMTSLTTLSRLMLFHINNTLPSPGLFLTCFVPRSKISSIRIKILRIVESRFVIYIY